MGEGAAGGGEEGKDSYGRGAHGGGGRSLSARGWFGLDSGLARVCSVGVMDIVDCGEGREAEEGPW